MPGDADGISINATMSKAAHLPNQLMEQGDVGRALGHYSERQMPFLGHSFATLIQVVPDELGQQPFGTATEQFRRGERLALKAMR